MEVSIENLPYFQVRVNEHEWWLWLSSVGVKNSLSFPQFQVSLCKVLKVSLWSREAGKLPAWGQCSSELGTTLFGLMILIDVRGCCQGSLIVIFLA